MLPTIPLEAGVYEDPELRFSDKGTAWVTIRTVAKSRKKDGQNNWIDGEPWFVTVKAFGSLAEHVAESVQRGDTIIAVGRLDIEKWTGKDGEERTTFVVIADEIGLSLRWATYAKEGRDNQAQHKSPASPSQSARAATLDDPPF